MSTQVWACCDGILDRVLHATAGCMQEKGWGKALVTLLGYRNNGGVFWPHSLADESESERDIPAAARINGHKRAKSGSRKSEQERVVYRRTSGALLPLFLHRLSSVFIYYGFARSPMQRLYYSYNYYYKLVRFPPAPSLLPSFLLSLLAVIHV